jgi:hypothetical protein
VFPATIIGGKLLQDYTAQHPIRLAARENLKSQLHAFVWHFVCFSWQASIIPSNNINQLIFVMLNFSVLFEVRPEILRII